MKPFFFFGFFFLLYIASAQTKPFRFAFVTDTHIGSPNGNAEEDLRRTVADINSMKDIDFVIINGDVTELGKEAELALTKHLLDSLRIRYYILPGNHDTGWSGSGGLDFTATFGGDAFHFIHNGIHFIGTASGPYVRMSDGHVPRHNITWLTKELQKIGKDEPIAFFNHYPLDSGLDNWYEVIDLLKQKNTILAMCGHGHNNRPVKAEGIPSVMGRSNLRAKEVEGGYNLVDIGLDSIFFTERKPLTTNENKWLALALTKHTYNGDRTFSRPDYSVNATYPQVKAVWTFHSGANVISTPAVFQNAVVFGNQAGEVQALDLKKGKKKWLYKTGAPIFSSPASTPKSVVFGSANGLVYALTNGGKTAWKLKTDAAVLGAALVENNVVYIGGSDGCMQALEARTGKPIWRYCGLKGAVTSQPVIADSILVFGAWDTNLYALHKSTGKLLWKWNNGSPVINYSPAACIPVIHNGVVYIVAPDRYLTAIDVTTGTALWRTNEATVRESIGLSEDGKLVYGKTMNDTIVAFYTNREKPQLAWKLNVGFGYEHVPSMLIENEGKVFFGTKNGVVYCINPLTRQVAWAHKIDNSMVNTIRVVPVYGVLASTMDGKVVLLQTQ